jgi:hypothetical protein
MSESLMDAWRTRAREIGMHLVDSDHPLQFFIGRDDNSRARAVIRSEIKPQKPNLSGLVHIDRFEDQSDMWNLSLVLQEPKFEQVFIRLVDDMHARTASAPNQAVAADRVSSIIDEWRRLLQARPMGLLTLEELRGLIGELWLLLNWFSRDRGLPEALEGWLGPLGLPQDFWFEQGGHYEAKSIGPATTSVKISSAEQLDPPDLKLLVLLIAGTDETQPGALNLPILVSRIHAILMEAGASSQPLLDRLDHLGVDLDQQFYQDMWFVISSVSAYEVTQDFPAIRASSLAMGIDRVRYQIDLNSIEPFRTSMTQVN